MPDHVVWMTIRTGLIVAAVVVLAAISIVCTTSCRAQAQPAEEETDVAEHQFPVQLTDEQWRSILTEEQYQVTRRGGTECAFTGQFYKDKREGVYHCVCCGNPLFSSQTKFESGTGWPSYFQPVGPDRIHEKVDRSHGMVRTEVLCARCGAHLGHVFQDGPEPTGLRYCINSAALELKPKLSEPSEDAGAMEKLEDTEGKAETE